MLRSRGSREPSDFGTCRCHTCVSVGCFMNSVVSIVSLISDPLRTPPQLMSVAKAPDHV